MKLRAKGFGLLLLLVLLALCTTIDVCDARRGKHWRPRGSPSSSLFKRKGKAKKGSSSHRQRGSNRPSTKQPISPPPGSGVGKGYQNPYLPSPSPNAPVSPSPGPAKGSSHSTPKPPPPSCGKGNQPPLPPPARLPPVAVPQGAVFNVVDFGAKGDGVSDDTKVDTIAFQNALIFQQYNQELERMPQVKPTALRFYGSFNVVVSGITIVNSSQCHLKFDNCQGVMVHDVTISSPENSLNTDGIHLQNSKEVSIHHTNLACGDDCISIQTGCSNINIHNVNCGPGHGISIGGLGRDNTKACVSNVTVRDVNMFRTMTGVRIKTWQGGIGLVQNIRFSNIQVSEVQTPIIIDQFYCDKRALFRDHTYGSTA